MLQAIVVDDEYLVRQYIVALLEETHRYNVLGAYQDAEEALAALPDLPPCLVFLDIEMPGSNGLACAERIRAKCPDKEVIMVTAHGEHALRAYEVGALSYLLKPVSSTDLLRLAERFEPFFEYRTSKSKQACLRLFGMISLGFHSSDGSGRLMEWRTAKAEELFVCLFLHQGSPLRNERLEEWLWPEHDGARARSLLHTTLYQMKRALADAGIKSDIQCRAGSYNVKFHGVNSDVDVFEAARHMLISAYEKAHTIEDMVSSGSRNPSQGKVSVSLLEQVTKAVAMYSGPLLGDHPSTWCTVMRDKYEKAYVDMSYWAARSWIQLGQGAKGIGIARNAICLVPWQEHLYGLILKEMALSGETGAFLQQYHAMEKALMEELGIQPSSKYRQLYDDVMRRLESGAQ